MSATTKPEDWKTVIHVAAGMLVLLIAVSMAISFLCNQTLPSIIPGFQPITWRTALGILMLLTLLQTRPVIF